MWFEIKLVEVRESIVDSLIGLEIRTFSLLYMSLETEILSKYFLIMM